MKLKLKRDFSTSRPELKVPRFAQDLYADLHDRRLLPLIVVLVVAIAAVPFLLAQGDAGEGSTPAPPVAATTPSAAQASFAVVPANPGLRPYRKRLGHRKAKDPFQTPPPKRSKGAGAGSAGSVEAPTAQAGGGGESAAAGGAPPTEATSPAGEQTTPSVVVRKQVIGYEIDARAGFLGHLENQRGIQTITKLPSEKDPVVVFMGLNQSKTRALFLMTSSVTAYYGKGRCALDKTSCQLLELKPGKSATFAYGYGDKRYKLILQKIVPIISPSKKSSAKVTGRS